MAAPRHLADRAYSLDSTPPVDYEPDAPIDYANASLTAIADHFKTDKGSIKHRYTGIYEQYLAALRKRQGVRLLEIGIACGSSLKTWARYFVDAQVVGVDVREECRGLCKGYPDISVRIADACTTPQPESFDIIIDDGSHISADIVDMFRVNWPSLKPGGFYFIEDLRCTHDPNYSNVVSSGAALDRFDRSHFVDFVNRQLIEMDWGRSEIYFLHFYRELAVICKGLRKTA